MNKDRERQILMLCTCILIFLLICIHLFDDARHINTGEYCARVAIYEQTKDTGNPRGHRDFENRGCINDQ